MAFNPDSGAHLGESLEDCLSSLGSFKISRGEFCNATWDGLLCWPPTLAGSTIRQSCPFATSHGLYAYKHCSIDGTWAVIGDPETLPGGHSPAGYTDYTQCFQPTTSETSTSSEEAVFSDYNRTMRIGEILQFTLSSVSIVSCLIAILFYIIIARRGNRCKIVIPLFMSMMTIHMMSLVAMTLRHVDKTDVAIHRLDYFCKLEIVLLKFSELSTYCWLMLLVIYYILIIMCSHVTRRTIVVLYVMGFGIPLATTMTWYFCVMFLIEMDNFCFVEYLTHSTIWVTITVKFLCIMVIFCLLTASCCTFCRFYDNDLDITDEFLDAKQGTLRVFIVTMVLTSMELYILVSDLSKGISAIQLYMIHYFIWIVCTTSRGLILAFFLCFIDKQIWSCQPSITDNSKEQESRDNKINNTVTNLEDIFGD